MPGLPPFSTLHLGSFPHANPTVASQLALDHCPTAPGWPQLPRRAFTENMYVQFSERFPGIQLEEDRIWVDRTQDLDPELETLYLAYLEDDLSYGKLSTEYAEGLWAFAKLASRANLTLPFVKGQVTGPVSWGLTVLDQDRRPVLYDDILADAIAKHLRLKARWQEQFLHRISPQTILSVDEPYMASFGSAYVALGRDQAVTLMEEVLGGIGGLKMVHCCGNTDWSLLLSTTVDILSFDAYEYTANLALYPEDIARFLDRGGMLAWGITPKTSDAYEETAESLVQRLEAGIELLVKKGLHRDDILQASLITPSCGLGSLDEALAEHVLRLTTEVSARMRERYA
jgi:methionine synthase II (cobalamin-independent)